MIIFSDTVKSYPAYMILTIHIVITHIICSLAKAACDLIGSAWLSIQPELDTCFLILFQLPVQSAVFHLPASGQMGLTDCSFFLFDGTHSLSVFFCRFLPYGAFVIYFRAKRKLLLQRRFVVTVNGVTSNDLFPSFHVLFCLCLFSYWLLYIICVIFASIFCIFNL